MHSPIFLALPAECSCSPGWQRNLSCLVGLLSGSHPQKQQQSALRVERRDRVKKSPRPFGLTSRGAGPCPTSLRAGVPPPPLSPFWSPSPAVCLLLQGEQLQGPWSPPPQEAARCLFHFYFLHRHLDTKEGKALLFSLDQRAKYSLWPSRSAQGFLLKPRGLGRGVRAQCSCLAPGSQTSHFLPRLPSVLTSPTPQTLKSNKGHWKR